MRATSPAGVVLRRCVLGCALLALAGCSFGGEIARHAVDYNRAVESSENQMFLLNVVRAYKGYPLHFTRISQISGALEVTGQVAGSPPLGADAEDVFDLSLALGGKSQPTFGIHVLNDQDFTKGILSPVSDDLFRLFRDQGWPMPVLLYALAESATIERVVNEKGETEELCRIVNDPDDPLTQRHFDALVTLLSQDVIRFMSTPGKKKDFGPELSRANIRELTDLIEIRKAGFATRDTAPGRFRLTRVPTSDAFHLPGNATTRGIIAEARGSEGELCRAEMIDRIRRAMPTVPVPPAREGEGKTVGALSVTITLRSAQGVLYFIGELARAALGTDSGPVETRAFDQVREDGELVISADDAEREMRKLFVLRTGEPGPAALSARHEGTAYWIPRFPHGGRSMQFLSLARQLFSLHLKAEEAPTTQTIRFLD